MSLTTNLLLELYVVLWIVNTLTIAREMSCLQLTISATELSCFSATLQSLWADVSTSVLFEIVDLNWEILFLEKCIHLDAFLALLKSWFSAAYF